MPHYGTLRETRLQQVPDDLRGAEVYGVNDERLGKIDDVIFDHASGDIRYVVVEAGGLFNKRTFWCRPIAFLPTAIMKTSSMRSWTRNAFRCFLNMTRTR